MIANRVGAEPPARLYPSTTITFNGDLDYIAIEKAMNGEPVSLTATEKIETARLLHDRSVPLVEIGSRVGVSRDTVRNWRDAGWTVPRTAEQNPIDIGGAKHGRSGYSKGCRCRTCRDGASQSARAYRASLKAAA